MQTVQVKLNFLADTSQAESALTRLQSSLKNITAQQNLDTGGYKMATQFNSASEAAIKLRQNLQSAVNVNTGALDLSKFAKEMDKSGMSLEKYRTTLSAIGPSGQAAFADLAKAIVSSETPITRSIGLMDKLWDTLKRTAGWQISSNIMHGLQSALSEAYNYAQDLNRSLNDIRIVTGHDAEKMAAFAKEANKAAKALSSTTLAYTDASLIYYQQGLNDEAVKERTDVTIKMANVTGTTAQTVSEQLTAVWENFRTNGQHTAEYYADVMTALGAATASSTDEIAEGLQKFASVADTIGLSYEYAASALTTITAKTRQSADVVGTALKTIFARLEGLNLGETLDDGTTLNKYSNALLAVGVNIKDSNGELKDMDTILDETADKWQTLDRDAQMALAQTVAGVRQYTQFVSLMDNWDFMEENLATSYAAEGTLDEQMAIYEESWRAAANRMQAAVEAIYDDLLSDDFFIWLTDGLADVVGLLDKVIDSMGGLAGVLPGLILLMNKLWGDKIASGISSVAYNVAGLIPSVKAKRDEADQAERTETIAQLQSMYIQNGDDAGQQMAQVYSQLNDLQEYRLKNAHLLNDTEQKTLGVLIEQAKYYAGIVEAQGNQVRELERNNKTSKNILRATAHGYDTTPVDDVNGYLSQNFINNKNGNRSIRALGTKGGWNQQKIARLNKVNSRSGTSGMQDLWEFYQDLAAEYEIDDDAREADYQNFKKEMTNTLLNEDDKSTSDYAVFYKRVQSYLGSNLGQVNYLNDLLDNFTEIGKKQGEYQQLISEYNDRSALFDINEINSYDEAKVADLKKWVQELSNAGVVFKKEVNDALNGLNEDTWDTMPSIVEEIGVALTDTAQGGAAHLDRVMEKLQRLFNISEEDLRAYRQELLKTGNAQAVLAKIVAQGSEQFEKQNQVLEGFDHAVSKIQKIQGVVNVASSIAMSLGAVKSIITTFNDDDISAWDKFTSILMSLPMVLPGVISAIQAVKGIYAALTLAVQAETLAQSANISVTTAAALIKNKAAVASIVEDVATEKLTEAEARLKLERLLGCTTAEAEAIASGKVTAAKLAEVKVTQLLGKALQTISKYKGLILLAVAIAAVKKTIDLIVSSYNATAEAAEKAQSAARGVSEAYNTASSAYNTLVESWNSYNTAKDNLDDLTKGTVEYTDAVREANDAALELINNYDGIKYSVNSDGLIELDEDSVLEARKEESKRLLQLQTAVQSAQNFAASAQTDADIEETARSMGTGSDFWPSAETEVISGLGGVIGGALAGFTLGSIVPGLGNIVGGLIGAGVAIGGAMGIVGGGIYAGSKGTASDAEITAIKDLANATEEQWAKIEAAQKDKDSDAFANAIRDVLGEGVSDGMINALNTNFDAVSDNASALKANTAALQNWMVNNADGANADNDYYNSLSDDDQTLAAIIRSKQISEEDIEARSAEIKKQNTAQELADKYFEAAGYDSKNQKIEKNDDGDWVLRTLDSSGNWNDGVAVALDEMAGFLAKTELNQITAEDVGVELAKYQAARSTLSNSDIILSDEDRESIFQNYAKTGEWDFSSLPEEVAEAFATALTQANFNPGTIGQGIRERKSEEGRQAYQDTLNTQKQSLSDEYGVTTGYIDEQTAAIMENNKAYAGNEKAALNLVESQLKMQTALEAASDEFETNKDDLTNWAKGLDKSLETQKKVNSFKKSLESLFGVSFDDDFLIENFETIQAALEGDEEAYKRLQKLAAEEVVFNITGKTNFDELDPLWQDLYNKIENMPDLEIGASIDQAGLSDAFQALLDSGAITVAQMNSILSQIGFTPEVAYLELSPEAAQAYKGHTVTQYEVWNAEEEKFETKEATTDTSQGIATDQKIRIPIIGKEAMANAQAFVSNNSGAKITGNLSTYVGKGSTGNLSPSSSGSSGGGSSKKDKKKASDEIERYHVIQQQIDRLATEYDALSAAKDRAYGPDKLAAIDKEIAKLQEQEEAQKKYIDEINSYYEKDRAAIAAYGAVFDKNGIITNYDSLMQSQIDKFNASLTDEAEEAYDEFKEILDQYEETLSLKLEEMNNLIEKQYEIVSAKLEKITYKVDFQIELKETDLNTLERKLSRLEDRAKKSFEIFNVNDARVLNYWQQYAVYQKAIWETQTLINETQAKGLEVTEEMIQKLAEYKEKLGEIQDKIYEIQVDNLETIFEMWDERSEQMEKLIDQVETYRDVLETIKDIHELNNSLTLEQKHSLDADIIKNYQAQTKMLQQQSAELAKQKEEFQATKNKFSSDGDKKGLAESMKALGVYTDDMDLAIMSAETLADKVQEHIDEIDEKMTDVQVNQVELANEYLEYITNAYYENIELIGKKIKGELYDGIEWAIERYGDLTNLSDLYLSDSKKIYELNKLNRSIMKDINKLDSVAQKQKLRDLLEEINGYYADNVQMSEYELKNLQAQYELRLAEIALEDARNAKSQVRLTRDNEGRWGYMYTANADEMAAAEQEYEDKMYALQELQEETLNEVGEKILQLQNEYLDKVLEISANESLTDEQKQKRIQQLTDVYQKQLDYYYTTYDKALAASGLAYEETILGQASNTRSLQEVMEQFGVASTQIVEDIKTETESFQNAFIEMVQAITGEQVTSYEEAQKAWLEYLGNQQTAWSEATTDAAKNFSAVMDTFNDIAIKFRELIQDMLAQLALLSGEDMSILIRQSLAAGDYDMAVTYANARRAKIDAEPEKYAQYDWDKERMQQEINQYAKDPNALTDDQKEKIMATTKEAYNSKTDYAGEMQKALAAGDYDKAGLYAEYRALKVHSDPKLASYAWTQADLQKQIDEWAKDQSAMTDEQKRRILQTASQYDTGGYTGSWGSDGRLAILHEKEIVLNKDDTENLLDTVAMVRQIVARLGQQAAWTAFRDLNAGGATSSAQTLEQNVHIEASFPNATDRNEIEQAFENLVNLASQYANRK